MRYWSLRRWRLLAGAASIAAACFLWIDGGDRVGRVISIHQAWQTENAKLADVASWKTERLRVRRKWRQLEQRYRHLYVSLPRHDQMSALLQVLHHQADSIGVELVEVRPGERVAFTKYDALPLDVHLTGAFHHIGSFVHAIEQSAYLMKVNWLQIKAPEVDGESLQADLRLRIVILKAET